MITGIVGWKKYVLDYWPRPTWGEILRLYMRGWLGAYRAYGRAIYSRLFLDSWCDPITGEVQWERFHRPRQVPRRAVFLGSLWGQPPTPRCIALQVYAVPDGNIWMAQKDHATEYPSDFIGWEGSVYKEAQERATVLGVPGFYGSGVDDE